MSFNGFFVTFAPHKAQLVAHGKEAGGESSPLDHKHARKGDLQSFFDHISKSPANSPESFISISRKTISTAIIYIFILFSKYHLLSISLSCSIYQFQESNPKNKYHIRKNSLL